MIFKNYVGEMIFWGILASLLGILVNLFHPHKIDYIRKPPPPEVVDENIPNFMEVDVEMAKTMWEMGDYLFVDSRSEVQYRKGHIKGAINLSWEEFEKQYPLVKEKLKSKPGLVIYCAGEECDLSHSLAKKLYKEGFQEIYVFFGGWHAWLFENLPVEASQ
ncbi:MAG: rhodanese-like domain-containing protein [Thermoanaerobaculia bacterium]